MSKYNFKEFFKSELTKVIHNDEYFSNSHFLINKSILSKSELIFINNHEQDGRCTQLVKNILSDKNDTITEFIPQYYVTDASTKDIVIMSYNNKYYAMNEHYYNFIKSKECKIYLISDSPVSPFHIYRNDELIGIVLPVRIREELLNNIITISERQKQIEELEQQKKQRKESLRKCLYINNNKAIVRNKELISIADIVKDNEYKNLYVEADYKNNYGEVFIDLGFIHVGIGRTIDKNYNEEDIKYSLGNLTKIDFNYYKNYINDCLKNMQFINVVDIKLMELAGEKEEYIQLLKDHRQKVLDLREKESQERELKRQQEKEQKEREEQEKQEQAIIEAEKLYKEGQPVKPEMFIDLCKKYDIKLPLKTHGWVNNSLYNISYDYEKGCNYKYYGRPSTVISNYAKQLREVM